MKILEFLSECQVQLKLYQWYSPNHSIYIIMGNLHTQYLYISDYIANSILYDTDYKAKPRTWNISVELTPKPTILYYLDFVCEELKRIATHHHYSKDVTKMIESLLVYTHQQIQKIKESI